MLATSSDGAAIKVRNRCEYAAEGWQQPRQESTPFKQSSVPYSIRLSGHSLAFSFLLLYVALLAVALCAAFILLLISSACLSKKLLRCLHFVFIQELSIPSAHILHPSPFFQSRWPVEPQRRYRSLLLVQQNSISFSRYASNIDRSLHHAFLPLPVPRFLRCGKQFP